MFAWRRNFVANLKRFVPLIVIIIAVGSGTVVSRSGPQSWTFHEGSKANLVTAHNLLSLGVFSAQSLRHQNAIKPRRDQPPGYPMVLAAIAALDGEVAGGLACFGSNGMACQLAYPFRTVSIVQAAAGVGILILIYFMTLELTGSKLIGYTTVVIFVVLARLGEFARHLRPDNFQNLAIFAGLALIALGVRRRKLIYALLAGGSFGIAGLFHPPFAYFVFAVPLILALIIPLAGRDIEARRFLLRGGGVFMLGAVVTLTPWALRNLATFGDPLLTDTYEARYLAMRIAYNDMSVKEWFASFIHWIPSYGDDLSRLTFGASNTAKLDGANPGTYYSAGPTILAKALAATPPNGHPLKQLIYDHIASAPLWHLATTLPIFTRGMWGSHGFFAIVGIMLLPVLIWRIRAAPQFDAAIAVIVTCVALAAIHALFTPNFFWFNLPMAFLAALTLAHLLEEPLRRFANWLGRKRADFTRD